MPKKVLVLLDGLGVGGEHEAGPAAAGVELGAAQEEQRAAAGAVVVAGFVVLGEGAGEGVQFRFHAHLLEQKKPKRYADWKPLFFKDFSFRLMNPQTRPADLADSNELNPWP